MSEELIKRLQEKADGCDKWAMPDTAALLREAADALSRPAPAVQVPEGHIKALHAAVAALYFDDSSDFGKALWAVVANLNPAIAELLEKDESAALHAVKVMLAAPAPATVATEAVAQGGGVGAGTLAKAIRRIDRRHDLSALSLAEAILAELPKANSRALLASPAVPVGDGMVGVPVEALRWLFGIGYDAFTEPPNAIGRFWWRSEFAVRAGIDQMALLLPPAPAATKKEN